MKTIIFFLIFTTAISAQWLQLGTAQGLPSNSEVYQSIGTIGDRIIISSLENGMFLSEDNGDTWRKPTGTEPTSNYINGSAEQNGKLFFGTSLSGIGVFVSSDKGENWDIVNSGLGNGTIGITGNTLLGSYNNKLFLTSDKFYMSEDDGNTWIDVSADIAVNPRIYGVTVIDNIFFCGEKNIYKSNDGKNWEFVPNSDLPEAEIRNLTSSGGNLIVSIPNHGVYYSSDQGISWSLSEGIPENNSKTVRDFVIHQNIIYASTNGQIFISTDDGLTWALLDEEGIRPSNSTHLVVTNNTLFASKKVVLQGALFKRPLDITDLKEESNSSPLKFSLQQNYPNPFNPTTKISFDLPVSGYVTLKIYDINGKEVAKLIDNNLKAGEYSVPFSANHLASGVYIYKINTNNFIKSKKMILLK